MHLVVFDIDGTLINTNPKDGECYWRVICELMGFSSEQPVSSPLYSVPMSSAIDASWGESEEATLRTLSSHRKLIDSLIEQRHGRMRQLGWRQRSCRICQRRECGPMRRRDQDYAQG